MSQICQYKTPEYYGNRNYEESEIDEGFDLTAFSGFNIKNCDKLIDSFKIKLSKEEKKIIIEEILDFFRRRPINDIYTYKNQFSLIKGNKAYNYKFICLIKKISNEKADIKYGIKELNKTNYSDVKDKREPSFWKKLCDKITPSCFADKN